METNKIIIYTDGGARGNPGPAAIGVYFETLNKRYSESIGETTNNVAEYKAIIFALKKCKQLVGKTKTKNTDIEIKSDSELAVKQLNGEFKLKDGDLIPLFVEIWNLKQEFGKIYFTHIPREKNKIADKLLNEELNRSSNKKSLF